MQPRVWGFLLLVSTLLATSKAMIHPFARKTMLDTQMELFQKTVGRPEKSHGPYYFDQPIDHSDPHSKTFKQRYWANTDWYKPGGPVILYCPGEQDASAFGIYGTSNLSMALLAKDLDGIIVIIEHRSYGRSLPAPDFSAESLKTLNTKDALADLANFIKTVKIPKLKTPLPPPPETKWIVYGGSYSGSLAAWMRYKYSDIVFASIPASAPVEARYNFYEYFEPIRKYGPKKCIRAIEAVVQHVDRILFGTSEKSKAQLKAQFGLEDLKYDDDFASALTTPMGLWQEMSPYANPFKDEFCAVFDHASGLKSYVEAYSKFVKRYIERSCEGASVKECLGTHNAQSSMYTNVTDPSRSWTWQTCTEYAYWQVSPPKGHPSIVSRKLDQNYYQRMCPLFFGAGNVPAQPRWKEINEEYGGWNVKLTKAIFIDGEWDPWRTLSVQSPNAPDRSTWHEKDVHYVILPKSVHCWDVYSGRSSLPSSIKNVHKLMHDTLKTWLDEAKSTNTTTHV
ncbi:hypothetical protein DFQ28_000083 [Apophysomyces sp. BC1034]|nr:hypothetical protein DFQ30_006688 [Apophysomyces sp. BC1015]KAG0183212.1 hypothetical protein DFQ29_008572 [Apophysomyces sp. BC1021]KAG0194385.1 hypothetical protein DFQ28_000083 [Apophysomyces sp. BC1034]